MWAHMIMARGFLRRNWLGWTLQVALSCAAVFICAIGMTLLQGVDRDLGRSAEGLSIDVLLADPLTGDRINELVRQLARRPDVCRIVHLDRDEVWQSFQSDIGVRSEGMADVAALPQVARLHLKSDYVTLRHASEMARSLRRQLPADITSIIMPSEAIADIEQRRADLYSGQIAFICIAAAICLAIAVGNARWVARRSAGPLARRLGRMPSWLRLGPTMVVVVGLVLAGLLARTIGMVMTPWLCAARPWLSEPFIGHTMTQVVLAMTGGAVVVLILMMFTPTPRVRGWQ